MKKRTILMALIVMLVSASMLFANGTSEATDEKVKLTFVEVMTNPARTQVLQGYIDEYEQLNPNVEIELVSPPYEQADNKLTMMLNSNQVIDICETRDHTVKQYVSAGKLRDLTPYLDKWAETDNLLGLTLEAAKTVDDTPYLIPECLYVKGLLVRTDILDKYGVEIPTTVQEFYAAAAELASKDPAQFGYAFRGKGSPFKISDIIMFGEVGNVDPNNCYKSLEDGKFIYDRPAGVKAFEDYKNLYKNAAPEDAVTWGFNEQINGFVSGTTPFLIQDPDAVAPIAEQLDASKFTAVATPLGASGKRYLDYGFAGFSIPTSSQHPDEAWDFISWLCSPEKNADYCKFYGPLPIHKSTFYNDPHFRSGLYQAWSDQLEDPNTVFVKYPFANEKYPEWSAQFNEQTVQALCLGKMTAEEVVKAMADFWGF